MIELGLWYVRASFVLGGRSMVISDDAGLLHTIVKALTGISPTSEVTVRRLTMRMPASSGYTDHINN